MSFTFRTTNYKLIQRPCRRVYVRVYVYVHGGEEGTCMKKLYKVTK